MYSWEKYLVRSSAQFLIEFFFFNILSCMSSLYILYINPLSDLSFANIFSHSVGCLFILLMVSFTVHKPLSLIRSHLFIFARFSCLKKQIQKNTAKTYVKECIACVSSRYFMVSGLTFRSLIHFEFIFVYSMRKYYNFILLHLVVQFSQHQLLKRLYFSPLYILVSFVVLIDYMCMGLFLGSLFCSFIYVFLCQYHNVLFVCFFKYLCI